MRRLYVVAMAVMQEHRQLFPTHLTTHWLSLYDPATPGDRDRWVSAGSPVVVSTEFTKEWPESKWEDHPAVTVLPHPVWYGHEPLTVARLMPENMTGGQAISEKLISTPVNRGIGALREAAGQGNIQNGEEEAKIGHDGIDHLTNSGLGILPTDSVVILHRKLAVLHPGFRLRAIK